MKLKADLSGLEALILFCIDNNISLFNFIVGEEEVDVYGDVPWNTYKGLIQKGYIDKEEQKIVKHYIVQPEEETKESSEELAKDQIKGLMEQFSVSKIGVANRMATFPVVKAALNDFFKRYPSITFEEIVSATNRMIRHYTNTGNNESIPNLNKFIIGITDTNSLYYWIQEDQISKESSKRRDNKLL